MTSSGLVHNAALGSGPYGPGLAHNNDDLSQLRDEWQLLPPAVPFPYNSQEQYRPRDSIDTICLAQESMSKRLTPLHEPEARSLLANLYYYIMYIYSIILSVLGATWWDPGLSLSLVYRASPSHARTSAKGGSID